MKAHQIIQDTNDVPKIKKGAVLATVHPANEAYVEMVLYADPNSGDGRSEWAWLRLPNGDLMLGMFPKGETYLACEQDAYYPEGEL